MVPRLLDGDKMLVNRAEKRVITGKTYAFTYRGLYRVNRLERCLDGSLIVYKNNSKYQTETLSPSEAEKVHIIGRVIASHSIGGLNAPYY